VRWKDHPGADLAVVIAEETRARPSDVQPWVAANALIGLHRSVIDYVRRETLTGSPDQQLRIRMRARSAWTELEPQALESANSPLRHDSGTSAPPTDLHPAADSGQLARGSGMCQHPIS